MTFFVLYVEEAARESDKIEVYVKLAGSMI